MSKKLRILFLTNRVPYPIKDGQTRRTFNILKGLASRHDVYLLSLVETCEEVMPKNVEVLKSFCKEVEMLPGPPKTLGFGMLVRLLRSLFSADPYTVWRHYSAAFADRVRVLLNTHRFDVIHCDILPLAYCMRGLTRPIRSLTDHDVSCMKATRLAAHARNPVLKIFLYLEALKLRRLESKIFAGLDLGIAVSERDRQQLQRLSPEGRFEVVENGVDVHAFVPNPSAIEPEALVWLGGFDHYSNCEAVRYLLRDIYPRIREKQIGAKLYIVGDRVPAWLTRLATGNRAIIVTGYVEDPLPYIQRAAVFVAPMLSGGGTKLKVLEAMAAGKAIVSTSIGVEGIAGEDGKHFVVADDPSAFASAVVDIMNDRDWRARLGANARRQALDKYDWQGICGAINRLYEDATGMGSNGGTLSTASSELTRSRLPQP